MVADPATLKIHLLHALDICDRICERDHFGADSTTTLSPLRPHNFLCASCSIMPNNMLYFCQVGFLNTAIQNFFHLTNLSEQSGEHTRVQLKQTVTSILWPTAHWIFCYLWRKLIPSITAMKPRSNLCWQCQYGHHESSQPTWSLQVRSLYKTTLENLYIVKIERKHHKTVCNKCKHSVSTHFSTNESLLHHPAHDPPATPEMWRSTTRLTMHSRCTIPRSDPLRSCPTSSI